jgi:hypothetical protein
MPGDELVPHPQLEATRAVSVAAPPERIWPWIVQMGYGRAGFYAIDWIDNAGEPSADRIVPEWQDLQVDDVVPTSPIGGFTVAAMDLPRSMVLHVPEVELGPVKGTVVTSMATRPAEDGTRLVARLRADFASDVASRLYALVFEPGDFVMMRLMLLGIKERAER